MKKTIIVALAVLGAVSCAKEEEQMPEKTTSFTIEAVIENNATKTQISDADDRFAMEWSDGDSFSLYDGASLITCNRVSGTSQFTSDQTPVTPDINNISPSGDPLQPETGLLYWSYTSVVK